MKKLIILTLLMTFSLIGFSQTSNDEFNQLVKKTSQYYNITTLASDSTVKFQLEEVRNVYLIDKTTNVKTPLYKLVFKNLDSGLSYILYTSSAKTALSGLNQTYHYILYDGEELFLLKKIKGVN